MRYSRRIRLVLDLVATLSMTVASGALLWLIVTLARGPIDEIPSRGGSRIAVENVEDSDIRISVSDAPTLGDPDARVALIEFSDFECPFCRRHARLTFDLLKREFVDSGKVAYVHFNLPLSSIHPNALSAAKAAACAGRQGHFWEMYTLLFSDMYDLALATSEESSNAVRLNREQFETCLENVAPTIQQHLDRAKQLKITGTPTFLLGTLAPDRTVTVRRRINGASSKEAFEQAIRELL